MMFYKGCGAAYKEWEGSAHKAFSCPESFSFSQVAQRKRILLLEWWKAPDYAPS